MNMNIENIGEYLKSHNIKPSYQRMKIFEYLLNNRTHPTVDEIYQTLVKEIPTLSKTTVFSAVWTILIFDSVFLTSISFFPQERKVVKIKSRINFFMINKPPIIYFFNSKNYIIIYKKRKLKKEPNYFGSLCISLVNSLQICFFYKKQSWRVVLFST